MEVYRMDLYGDMGRVRGKPVKGSRASVGEAVTTIGLKGKGEEGVTGTN